MAIDGNKNKLTTLDYWHQVEPVDDIEWGDRERETGRLMSVEWGVDEMVTEVELLWMWEWDRLADGVVLLLVRISRG